MWIDGTPTLVGGKPGSKPALGRLAGRVSPNHPRPGITLPNTKLPPITLSVTKTLLCTGPGLKYPQYSCFVNINLLLKLPPRKKKMHLWWIISFDCVITAIEVGGG